MPRGRTTYSVFYPPSLSATELVKTTLDHDSTDMLIDRWLEHRTAGDAYHDWFLELRRRRCTNVQTRDRDAGKEENGGLHGVNGKVAGEKEKTRSGTAHAFGRQMVVWNKGDFQPENVFCRTVDTGRLIPLDRTWTTHVYHHSSMCERRLSMMPVVFTMLPELMLLRGMHDTGCDEIYVIVTDMKRQEMDDVSEYFKLVSRYCFGTGVKPSIEAKIQAEHTRLSHTLLRQHRTPCFPQIDLTFRAIVYEKKPRFIVLFSHHTTSYSQIFFTHSSYVPEEEIFYDYPTGCPNPCCTEDCEMIRFPRRGVKSAAVLKVKTPAKGSPPGKGKERKVRKRDMCNWIDCDAVFGEYSDKASVSSASSGSSEGSEEGEAAVAPAVAPKHLGQICSKCKMVKYCSPEHQRKDWEEHKRVCVRA